jgi:hypothetical protein
MKLDAVESTRRGNSNTVEIDVFEQGRLGQFALREPHFNRIANSDDLLPNLSHSSGICGNLEKDS